MDDAGTGITDPSYKAIRYGLAAIKNVGETAMAMAIRERDERGEFSSSEDFCSRLDSRVANRKMLESLIKAGAFDFTGRDRAELFGCIEDALASSAALQRDRVAGQVSLFDEQTHAATATRRQSIKPWNEHEKLSFEKELLGFYVSGHPLDAYADLFAARNYRSIASLGELDDRAQFKIAGAIVEVEKKFTRKEGKPFAVVWLEDLVDMIVKVKEPLAAEFPLLRSGQILFTYLHLAASKSLTEALLKSGVTAVAYETIQTNHRLPLLEPMSEIAGRMSTVMGANFLAKYNGGSGVLLGGVPGVLPGRVVVVGGGTSGVNAARMFAVRQSRLPLNLRPAGNL